MPSRNAIMQIHHAKPFSHSSRSEEQGLGREAIGGFYVLAVVNNTTWFICKTRAGIPQVCQESKMRGTDTPRQFVEITYYYIQSTYIFSYTHQTHVGWWDSSPASVGSP